MGTLSGKTAFVTGGSGNIGRAVCLRMGREGARVAVADIRLELAEETAAMIRAEGGEARAYALDVRSQEDVETVFQRFIDDFGTIDILVNVAGGSSRSKIRHLKEQDFAVVEDNIRLNLFGALLTMHQASRIMAGQRSGRIINTTSIVAAHGKPGNVEYAAAKGGIIAASKTLAIELGPYNVTVNCVSPGIVALPGSDRTRYPATNVLGTLCEPEDIANMIHYLATDEAKFITGAEFVVDGGRSLGLRGD